MSHDLRWAARYAFVRELWSGRARVVVDARLEALLVEGGPDAGTLGAPLVELVDELVPRRRSDPVWVVVHGAATAAELAQQRPGTSFVDIAALPGVLRSRPWEVALVDLAPLLEQDGERPGQHASALLSDIGSMLDGRRVAVVSAPARAADAPGGLGYAEVSAWAGRELGGGRLWGAFGPRVAGFVEYGEPIEAVPEVDVTSRFGNRSAAGSIGSQLEDEELEDEELEDEELEDEELEDEELEDEELEDDEAEDAPVQFDNTLGGAEPAIDEWLILSGGQAEPGLTLVEVPGDEDVATAMRLQLAQARRQIDLAAIERQGLIERLDAAHARLAELETTLGDVHDRLGGTPAAATTGEFDVDEHTAILAREQALRWRVRQLEEELEVLRQAPPTELEAELASLRARVQDLVSSGPASKAPGPGDGPEADSDVAVGQRGPASTATYAVLRAVDGLVRRIERGGIGALELRRELEALRRRLRPAWTE